MTKDKEFDRLSNEAFKSVASAFGREDSLQRLDSGMVELSCPECHAKGKRFGNPGEDFRFEGFTPLTKGGLTHISATCEACKTEVLLPHKKA